ncbi:ATP-binding protein [Methanococcoides sp. SA1]|nr:ATP-binding protein [Methanococcoides sp. SA1]
MGKVGEVGLSIIGLENEIEQIQSIIDDLENGKGASIAIIAEPFSGKTTLINEICSMNKNKVEMISLSSVVKDEKKLQETEKQKKIKIIENCHFLYRHKIGGFDIIERFLKNATSPENKLYITTWNVHSWNFLENTHEIGKYFPVQIKLQGLTQEQTRQFILSEYKEGEIQFIEDPTDHKEKMINVVIDNTIFLNKEIGIPHLKINYRQIKSKISRKKIILTPEEKVFENIYSISQGNPGISKAIWERYLIDPQIKPGDIKEPCQDIELDNDESFILSILVSMQNTSRSDIIEIAGDDIDIERALQVLSKKNIINIEEEHYKIKPEMLKCATNILKRSRLV